MITELTPNTSSQELFDYITDFLFKQGGQSTDDGGSGMYSCMYRSPGGRMCAFGCIIPDSIYVPSMEGLSAEMIIEGAVAGTLLGITEDGQSYFQAVSPHSNLIIRLQQAHDGPPTYWDSEFAAIAKDFDLQYTRRFTK